MSTRSGLTQYDPVKWLNAVLLNSWTKFNAGIADDPTPGYTRTADGFVFLRGAVGGGSNGTTAFVLPEDFRPRKTARIATICYNGVTTYPGLIAVFVSGEVKLYGSGTTQFVLHGAFDTRA